MASPAQILRAQRAKAPSRARVAKGGTQGGRFILQNKDLARRSAKGQITRAINKGLAPAHGGGQELKFSIEKMGERLNLDSETMDKLRAMEPEKLQALYDSNDLVFDVFFSYEGVDDRGDFITVDSGKQNDADFFIQQYERAFGRL